LPLKKGRAGTMTHDYKRLDLPRFRGEVTSWDQGI
jgi:hypothetical protein